MSDLISDGVMTIFGDTIKQLDPNLIAVSHSWVTTMHNYS